MRPIELQLIGSKAYVSDSPHPITSGMVGLVCNVTYNDEWAGLIKNAVIKGNTETRVVLNCGDSFTVPWECLSNAGGKLHIGIEGKSAAGDVVFPSRWAFTSPIEEGVCSDAEEGTDPTPSQAAQLQAAIAAEATARQTADAGKANANHTHAINGVTGLQAALDEKQKKLTAGSNITISDDGTISATGGGGGSGSSSWDSITGKPSTFPPSAHEHGIADITDMPSIPTDTLELTNGAGYITADEVPIATAKTVGTVKLRDGNTVYSANASGLSLESDGNIGIFKIAANNYRINSRFFAVTNKNFADILKAELTDGYGTSYTETEQAAARARLGISIWDGSVSE